MKKKYLILLLALPFLFCSKRPGYNMLIKDSEKLFYEQKQPYMASKSLIDEANNENEDQLLFMMEAGYLLHSAEKFDISNKVLLNADKKSEELAVSVTEETLAVLSSDTTKDYKPEDYERVLLNMTLGLNFLLQEDYDSALVEFKKVNYKLNMIKEKTGRIYKVNLMAKYLASISAAYADDLDYAYIELKQIEDIKPGIPYVVRDMMKLCHKLKYMDDFKVLARKYPKYAYKHKDNLAEIIVVYEEGLSPIKESRGSLLEVEDMRKLLEASIQMSIASQSATGVTLSGAMAMLSNADHPIPEYKIRDYDINKMIVTLEDDKGKKHYIEPVLMNDIENTMIRNFEDNYNKMKNKMVLKIAAKVVTAIVAQQLAEKTAKQFKKTKGIAGLIGAAAGIATSAVLFSLEEPDLRCWHTIPAAFQAASLLIPQGSYKMKVSYFNRNGELAWEKDSGTVELSSKKPGIFLFRTVE
ncbi:MAG: hypothetical protein OEZ13_11785 [Spirochaetia bacterium]|nr:hypothetical protein [Spirochaetia bacterium]